MPHIRNTLLFEKPHLFAVKPVLIHPRSGSKIQLSKYNVQNLMHKTPVSNQKPIIKLYQKNNKLKSPFFFFSIFEYIYVQSGNDALMFDHK